MAIRFGKIALVMAAVALAAAFAVQTGAKAESAEKLAAATQPAGEAGANMIALAPIEGALAKKFPMSVTEALAARRSQRAFTDQPLTGDEISLLCWAAQGVTDAKTGHRTAPSGLAVYPMTVYMLTDQGMCEYIPQGHQLKEIKACDAKAVLYAVAKQECMKQARVVFAIAMDAAKAKAKLGESAEKCCFFEAGHIAQNILLEATSMGLAGVPAAGFDSRKATEALGLPAGQEIIYVVPVGHPK